MSFWNKITGQFIDVIEWVDDSRDTLIYKFPDEDMEIKMGAQLTVRESQNAIFINEGKLADVFTPGRYELTTRNMPIMTTLKSWKYGFDSPFKADVYFVNTRIFSDMKWGTKQPIMVSDPEFSLVQLRAFGSFNFRIQDISLFFKNFAGTDPHVTTDEVLDHFRSRLVTEFSKALVKSGKSLVEINSRAHELGEELLPLLQNDFKQVGLEILQFMVESISLPPEIQKALTEQDLTLRGKRRSSKIENEAEFENIMGKANISQNIPDMEKFMEMQAALGMNQADGTSDMGEMSKAMLQMNMMQKMMEKMNSSNDKKNEATASPQEGKGNDKKQIMNLLKELGELKEAGILTEEEFQEKKKDLLSRL